MTMELAMSEQPFRSVRHGRAQFRICRQVFVAGASSLWLTLFNPSSVALAGNEFLLLTTEEAQQLDLTDEQWNTPRPKFTFRGKHNGPRIAILRPELVDTDSGPTVFTGTPLDILIVFEATDAPILMKTLRVKAKKGMFTRSLTDRLTPYIRGTTLDVRGAEVPTGRFNIVLEISDAKGVRTVTMYRLSVN